MVLNLYIVFLTFLLGLVFGFIGLWLWNNHHRRLVRFILGIMVALLVIDGIRSVFSPDTLLRQTYSGLQGWVDFVFGFFGWMLGCYLENRYEQNRKFKMIVHIPRQAPANPREKNPKLFGFIKIVPEKDKERENEQFVMGGLPKYVLDRFLGMPRKEQALLAKSTVNAVGELRQFQHKIANITSIPELADELKGLTDTPQFCVSMVLPVPELAAEVKVNGRYDERFQLWLGQAKLDLIKVRLDELSKMPKNRNR